MDKSHLAELRHQYRRAQGSVNYWGNAVRSAQRAADKHSGSRQAGDLARLKEFENKAAAAQQQLTHIKAQLTELDPKGARARQLNGLRSAIGRANKDIAHIEHLTQLPGLDANTLGHYQAKLNARRAKLAELTDALARERANTEAAAAAAAARDQAINQLMAVANAAYSFDPCAEDAEQQLERLDAGLARHGLRQISDTDFDRHEPAKPRRPLH